VILVTDSRRPPLAAALTALASRYTPLAEAGVLRLGEVSVGLRDEDSSLEVKSRRKIRC